MQGKDVLNPLMPRGLHPPPPIKDHGANLFLLQFIHPLVLLSLASYLLCKQNLMCRPTSAMLGALHSLCGGERLCCIYEPAGRWVFRHHELKVVVGVEGLQLEGWDGRRLLLAPGVVSWAPWGLGAIVYCPVTEAAHFVEAERERVTECLPLTERVAEVILAGASQLFPGTAWRYKPRQDQWSRLPEMLTQRQDHAGAALNGFFYVAGGYNSRMMREFSCMERFDVNLATWAVAAPMTTARSQFAMAAAAGMLYACGGLHLLGENRRRVDQALCSVERYDPRVDQWRAVAPMVESRRDHALVALEDKLFVCGGSSYRGNFNILSSVERYHKGRWWPVASMNVGRVNFGLALVCRSIYALGGLARHHERLEWSAAVERYDLDVDRWLAIKPLSTARDGMVTAVVDESLFVIGGCDCSGSLPVVECYDPRSNTWNRMANMPFRQWCKVGGTVTATRVVESP